MIKRVSFLFMLTTFPIASAPLSVTGIGALTNAFNKVSNSAGLAPGVINEDVINKRVIDKAENEPFVYIVSPKDGAEVTSPVTVIFGVKGMGVAPAGVEKAKTGHHHLIVDSDLPSLTDPIPSDKNHIHFGGGQTEITLDLEPGKHSLQLLFGDYNHVPHSPALYSDKITISVIKK